MDELAKTCWVCGSRSARLYLQGRRPSGPLDATRFRITDHDYGTSATLWQCGACGFVYADPLPADDLLAMYEQLDDPEYVDGRPYRLAQMQTLMAQILHVTGRVASLLDVGAGTGMLVEAAQLQGLRAAGVEPSRQLSEEARSRGLDVHTGVLPHTRVAEPVDVVTCVDVIEHVQDPVGLLHQLAAQVAPGGWVVVTTPDPDSVARRLLLRRWWHFRLAHVCFLPTTALDVAARRTGLQVVRRERQTWWFSIGYLAERVGALLGGARAAGVVASIQRSLPGSGLLVPLNLYDSWVVFLRPDGES